MQRSRYVVAAVILTAWGAAGPVGAAPGGAERATGGGWLLSESGEKVNFGVGVRNGPTGPRGEMQIIGPEKVAHHLYEVLAFSVQGNHAHISGLCRDNRGGGKVHQCEVDLTDNGGGSTDKADHVSFLCSGALVAAGPVLGGNVQVVAQPAEVAAG